MSVIDLRNPARSGGFNFLTLVNPYMDQAVAHPDDLAARAKAVYIYLKDHANKEGTCWPGIKTIAAGVSLSRSTMKRALVDLVKAGLVEKTSRWRENGSLSFNLYKAKTN